MLTMSGNWTRNFSCDRGMVFNVTFNNISAISWRSVLFVEETGGSTRRKPPTCRKSLTKTLEHYKSLNDDGQQFQQYEQPPHTSNY
jgi:hypothetical protein